jgi:hypothetical protein
MLLNPHFPKLHFMKLECGSRYREPALQAQSPEFKPQSHRNYVRAHVCVCVCVSVCVRKDLKILSIPMFLIYLTLKLTFIH